MFCSKCGNEIKEGEKFCAKCGNKIENISIMEGKIKEKEQGNFKMHFSWGIFLFYTIFMFFIGAIISIFCGADRILNIFSAFFGIIGLGGGFMNSFSIRGICPICNKETQCNIQNTTTINGYTSFDCPMCGNRINVKR